MPSRQRDGRPAPPRRFSSHLRQHRQNSSVRGGYGTFPPNLSHRSSELENLLEEQYESEEHADSDGLYPPHCCYTANHSPPAGIDLYGHDQWPVYLNIHKIRHEVMNSVDDPYSLDQLKAPRMNISVVRPLVDQFYRTQDLSIVYCLLVNRTQFIREQSYAAHHQTVNLTRALLCEIVAEKILRRYNEDNPGPKGLLKLANILVAAFEPFQNAPDDVFQNNHHILHYVRQKDGKVERKTTALEVAIIGESKSFLASSACQKVVDAIYRGKLVYTPNSFIDILPDYWKRRPISLYDPRRGPILNQYRLVVPRTRNVIDIAQFLILLVLYLIVMDGRETRLTTTYTPIEAVFELYTWGWILDQLASVLEHGWQVYTQSLWSFLDVIFTALFTFYFIVRMHARACTDPQEAIEWARLALDALSCAAPILIPRLAFNILSENMVFLCLRHMLSNFITLVFLASWCFIGFLLTLKWLHNGLHAPLTIGKWMIWIWFGLDGTGIDKAPEFHWLLGPVVMVMFAFLGNTLFVTILVSMLSNTFSIISANAVQEMQFRRSVLTFEGVKADAIFYYMPPFNLLAMLFLLPLKFILTPRWFHKVNVFAAKSVNAPLLILISLYERRTLWISSKYRSMKPKRIDWRNPNGPSAAGMGWWSRTFQFWDLSRLSVHGDLQAVFDEVPATTAHDDEHDEGIGKMLREDFLKQFANKSPVLPQNGIKKTATEGARSGPMPTLKQDFPDDSDEHGDDKSDSAPRGYKKLQPRVRKDSIMDLGEGGSADLTEANARLHKLEESIQRIEALLVQFVGGGDAGEEGGDNEVEEMAEDIAEGIDPTAE